MLCAIVREIVFCEAPSAGEAALTRGESGLVEVLEVALLERLLVHPGTA